MADKLFLCLDQGGSASRALVISAVGKIICESRQSVVTRRPQTGWVEHDPRDVLDSLHRAAKHVLAQLSASQKNQVISAGLVTQRSSLVCWDKNSHEALTPVISWQDTRAKKGLENLSLSFAEIQQRTGLVANAHLGATKYQWCLQQLPEVNAALTEQRLAIGSLASYLVYQLCDEHPHVVDPANAARTLLWNIHRNNWDDDLLNTFAIPRFILPEIKPTISDWGTITIDDFSLPLRLVNGDQSSAIFGFGELLAETAYINIGTGAFISLPLQQLPEKISPLLCSPCLWTDQPMYLLEGTVHGANSALYEWADKRAKILSPDDLRNALAIPQAAVFVNGIGGLGSPDWISEFPSRFIGAQDDAAQIAGILQSIVFLLQRNLEVLLQRATIKQLVISGGLAQLDGICQRIADLSGLPVIRPTECEATALGVAFCLADQPVQWPIMTDSEYFLPKNNPQLLEDCRIWNHYMFEK
jgi:glycerol kinase